MSTATQDPEAPIEVHRGWDEAVVWMHERAFIQLVARGEYAAVAVYLSLSYVAENKQALGPTLARNYQTLFGGLGDRQCRHALKVLEAEGLIGQEIDPDTGNRTWVILEPDDELAGVQR